MNITQERVALGALWMDENHPGWHEIVDPGILHMPSSCRCILGQTKGDYCRFLGQMEKQHGLTDQEGHLWAVRHGFTLAAVIECCLTGWVRLNALWRREIQKRREAAPKVKEEVVACTAP